ncbi:MAG: hypothetical protein Q7J98_04295 [Kiritimatiellia bacterium]|nr:hypothetical protein [Kiritimatiellia bacterium]
MVILSFPCSPRRSTPAKPGKWESSISATGGLPELGQGSARLGEARACGMRIFWREPRCGNATHGGFPRSSLRSPEALRARDGVGSRE